MFIKKTIPILCLLALCSPLFAQKIWNEVPAIGITSSGIRHIVPEKFRTVALDLSALQNQLEAAPLKSNGLENKSLPIFEIPTPDGKSQRFRLVETPVMAPALQAQYPNIRTYTGYGIEDPTARLKCDLTPQGFHAMVLSARRSTYCIAPYSTETPEIGIVYYRKDNLPKGSFTCATESAAIGAKDAAQPALANRSLNDGQLRTYRLALACTGEYAQFHGGNKPDVLAAMVVSMHRVNGVYENEFSVTMEIVPGNDTLIYLDAATDPYENNDGGTMLGQNVQVCNTRIGSQNYDMGHVFSTGGGGIAGLGVICAPNKANGVTGQAAPIGDYFDIDYVAHEMGHQFSGNHTQNNSCNRAGGTSMEPGSASTIMGYAGICAPDVQPHSDDYFHGVNVEEIINFITDGGGNTCPVKTPTLNTAPIVNAGIDRTIPKSTPFALNASGSDAENDALTYCWEQMDETAANMPPSYLSSKGPLFRSFLATESPKRIFPQLDSLAANQNPIWEELPGVTRKMNFRVTARDNNPAGGSIAWDDMLINVDGTSGPFRIVEPAAAAQWQAGGFQNVTWNVAKTNLAPVNCQTVNIRLSYDGGLTYPVTLATGAPNNGSACVLVPDSASTTARILVEAADNIFFDLNNDIFTITTATAPGFSFCPAATEARVCLPNTYSIGIGTVALGGFTGNATFSVEGLPTGAEAVFTPNPAPAGAEVLMEIISPDTLQDGTANLTITAQADTVTASRPLRLNFVSNDYTNFYLRTPVDGASGVGQTVFLRWNDVPAADFYDIELATNPSFDSASIVFIKYNTAIDSAKVIQQLEKNKGYYWHVRPKNECGSQAWSEPFFFSTLVENCTVRTAGDLPKNITSNGTPTITSKVTVPPNAGNISDINIKQIKGNHAYFRDLEMHLIGPDGTDVFLFKEKCGNFSGPFNFGIDDNAPSGFPCPPANNGNSYTLGNVMTPFIGQPAAGDWTLSVKDNSSGSGGTISDFQLEVCGSASLNPPYLVNNNTLQIMPGSNRVVTPDLLLVQDDNNTSDQLIYTLVTVPQNGHLVKGWTGIPMKAGDEFTQDELNQGFLTHFDYGISGGLDGFRFSVRDGEGGYFGTPKFNIQPFPVSVNEVAGLTQFQLFPNPTNGNTTLAFQDALPKAGQVSILNAAGQVLRLYTLQSGDKTLTLDTAGLPNGIYAVMVQHEKGSVVRKLVVAK